MTALAYARPVTLEETLELLAEHGEDAHLMAGGTSVVLLLKQGLLEPTLLVGLSRLAQADPTWVEAQSVDGAVRIGALMPLRRLETDALVQRATPAVADAVSRVATARIRNQATIGGNLAHADPAQDPPPMLLVHDAIVELTGRGGRREVAIEEFFVDMFETAIEPGEVLTAIRVPVPAAPSSFAYRKFLPRTVDDYATISVAVRLDRASDGTIADARIALANAGPIPFRARQAEDALRGQRPTPSTLRAAAAIAEAASDPVGDVRGSAEYKRMMVGVWTARALLDLVAEWPAP